MHHTENKERCSCPHHIFIPVFIAVIGITFLLKNIGLLGEFASGILWPTFTVLTGLQLIFAQRCKCQAEHAHCKHCHHCLHDGKAQQ